MKLILICNHPKYLYTRRTLVNSLKENNELFIAAPFRHYPSEFRKEIFKEFGCKTIDFFLSTHGINPFRDIKTCINLLNILRLIKPDYILNFTVKPNIYGTIAAKVLRIKSMNNITGLGTLFMTSSLSSIMGRFLYLFSQSFAHRIFFQNSDDLELFTRHKYIRRDKCLLIPGSGVDLSTFYYCPITESSKGNINFLYVGKLFREKGVFEMFEAFRIINRKFPSIKFTIVGPVTDKDPSGINKHLESLVSEGIIKYYGETDDVRPYLIDSDCVILPSYREGTPRSLLEASAMGRPVIATYVPGCKGVIEDGLTGYFFRPRDVDDMVIAMGKIISASFSERLSMGRCGRSKMEKEFDENIVAKRYVSEII